MAVATYTPTTVVEVPTLAELRNITVSGATPIPVVVNVQAYSAVGDGGGGTFVRNGTSCTSLDDDGGVVIKQDSGHNSWCWYRQFSGPVHIAWYGATDAAANTGSPCYATETAMKACDSAALLKKAFTASRTFGDGGVVTDGRSIVLSNASALPEIPSTQYLSCSGPPGAQRSQLTQNLSNATQYYTLPNSLILDPGIAGNTIVRDRHTRFRSCIIRPTWYTRDLFFQSDGVMLRTDLNTQYVIDNIEHRFLGTATKCGDVDSTGQPTTDGEACDMDDVLIIGFDTCDDTANAPRAHLVNLKFECNVGEAIHANGGGMNLRDASVHNFIEAIMKPNGADISRTEWPIGAVTQDATNGEVKITFSPTGSTPLTGDNPILIAGFGSKSSTPAFGNNGPPALNARWNIESLTCAGTCSFDLQGSSWAGPNYIANWNAGSNVLSVTDTTNIAGGQFLCGSPTSTPPPFCSPPTGFGPASGVTFTLGDHINSPTTLPSSLQINAGPSGNNITSWPQRALVCIYPPASTCSATGEYLGYKLVDATHIQITARGVDGTSATTHSNNDAIVPSAPLVIAPIPSLNKVIVTATASAPGTAVAAYFLNDHTAAFSAGSDCSTAGSSACIILNANYRTWTANTAAGDTPNARLTVAGTASGSTPTGGATLSISGNLFKVQPGMTVADLDTSGNIGCDQGTPAAKVPILPYVDKIVSASDVEIKCPGTVHYTGADFSTAQRVQFSGCGYPGDAADTSGATFQPWLGNCAATAYLFYGTIADYGASGVACDTLNSHGWRVYFHTNNGQQTVCSKLIFDSGAGGVLDDNDTADPTSIGIWTEGDAEKIELAQGKAEARTPFLNTGDPANDNVTLANFNLRTNNDYSLAFANAATSTLSDIHGGASSAGYADSTQQALSLTGNNLTSTSLYFDDPAKFRNTTNCANNIFASSPCADLLVRAVLGGSAPALGGSLAGLGTISGNDTAGRIVLGSITGTSTMTLNFAATWPSPPVCLAQVETSTQNLGTVSTISTTSVTFKFAANLASNQAVSYQCLGFR